MSHPTESKTIDRFEKKGYESSDTPNYRPNGVKIIKAVKLYSQKDDNKTKMKLEEILGQTATNEFLDSAWGKNCTCNTERDRNKWENICSRCCCNNECRCVDDCGCDNHCECLNA